MGFLVENCSAGCQGVTKEGRWDRKLKEAVRKNYIQTKGLNPKEVEVSWEEGLRQAGCTRAKKSERARGRMKAACLPASLVWGLGVLGRKWFYRSERWQRNGRKG